MDDKQKLALDFVRAFIQNSNVKPVFSYSKSGGDPCIEYLLGDTRYSFSSLVSHFLDNIERFEKWS